MNESLPIHEEAMTCTPGEDGHCVTCSDEALQARVLRVDQESGLALVNVNGTTEEIDITLVDSIAPGDLLLVHGGVAIGLLEVSHTPLSIIDRGE